MLIHTHSLVAQNGPRGPFWDNGMGKMGPMIALSKSCSDKLYSHIYQIIELIDEHIFDDIYSTLCTEIQQPLLLLSLFFSLRGPF